MGRTDLNVKIGNESFYSLPIVSPKDTNICNQNCVLIEEKCSSSFFRALASLFDTLGLSEKFQCPLR